MADLEAKWHGFESNIATIPKEPDRFRVSIYPKHLKEPVDPFKGPGRVPSPAVVIVARRGAELDPIEYLPPEKPYPGLGQVDYERRAVELVGGQTRLPA
jgi:hypothetical protein